MKTTYRNQHKKQVLLDGMEVGLAELLAGQEALRAARSLDGGLCLSLQE